MVKYSIILPIYKVENYLEECVNSVLAQKIKDYELILVDDGSPDNCPKMCDEFAKKDPKIKVVHKKNGGLSDARNAGIKVAKGKFILFIDPDDYVEKDYLEVINENVDGCDLLIFGHYVLYKNKRIKERGSDEYLDREKALDHLMSDSKFCGFAWNKVYKKEILDKYHLLYDPDITMCEDMLFSYEYMKHVDNIKVISDALINYRQRKSSFLSKKVKDINPKSFFETYGYIMHDSDNAQVQRRSKFLYLKAYYKYKRNDVNRYVDKALIKSIIKNDYKNFTPREKKFIKMFKYVPDTRTLVRGMKDLMLEKYE